jgi:acyl-coenzyme A synthetase/AMP-(fatty) acid ligase
VKTPRHSPITTRARGDIIAWSGPDAIVRERFLAIIEVISSQLPPKAYAFNLCTNPLHYLLGFYAAVLAGQCTLMPPNRLKTTLNEIREDYRDSYILGDRGDSDFDIGDALRWQLASGHQGETCPDIPEEQLCAIAFTSGSTGQSQPNRKYWRTLVAGSLSNARMLLRGIQLPTSVLSTVPPQHMWGLETSILLPAFGNVSISGRSPFYPQEIKEALQALPAPRILVSTPVHLRALVNSGLELVSIDRVLSATAPMTTQLAVELERAFDTSVLDVFGCSESGILAARSVSKQDEWSLANIFQLDIVDGRARITATHLPEDVYLQDAIEKLSAHEFRWLGRHQDMVNIAGKRASLADINRRLLDIAGVRDGVVFFPSEAESRLAAMVVAPGLTPRSVLNVLRAELDPVFLPRPLLMVERLPRTESGKLPRRALLEMFAQLRSSGMSSRCS